MSSEPKINYWPLPVQSPVQPQEISAYGCYVKAIPSIQTRPYPTEKHPVYPSGERQAVTTFAQFFQPRLSEAQPTASALIPRFYCARTGTVKDRSRTFANRANNSDHFPR